MRFFLLFILAMVVNSIANAQHFTDAGNSWTITQVNWELKTAFTFQIKIDRDTLIQNQVYKTLLQADDAYNPVWYRVTYLIREDDQHIVYILDTTGQEGILYHFGLEVGQQVVLWNGIRVTAQSIDSVQVANNQMQRRVHIRATYGPPGWECSSSPWWIDDIGGTSGPVPNGYYCLDHDIDFGLGCFLKNDDVYLPGEPDSWCEEFTTTTIPVTEMALSIFPNPVIDLLTIQFHDALYQVRNIHLYNSQGQLVYHQVSDESNQHIDMSSMASGIFFLNVASDKENLFCKKIMKL
jgi:hypothetical protein